MEMGMLQERVSVAENGLNSASHDVNALRIDRDMLQQQVRACHQRIVKAAPLDAGPWVWRHATALVRHVVDASGCPPYAVVTALPADGGSNSACWRLRSAVYQALSLLLDHPSTTCLVSCSPPDVALARCSPSSTSALWS